MLPGGSSATENDPPRPASRGTFMRLAQYRKRKRRDETVDGATAPCKRLPPAGYSRVLQSSSFCLRLLPKDSRFRKGASTSRCSAVAPANVPITTPM